MLKRVKVASPSLLECGGGTLALSRGRRWGGTLSVSSRRKVPSTSFIAVEDGWSYSMVQHRIAK